MGTAAIVILVIVLVVVALAIILVRKFAAWDPIGDFGGGGYVETPQPWDRPFEPTGDADLPYAIRLGGKAWRWQQPDRVKRGADFYRMFEDGPWKWEAQGRFAGTGINCGHYFGLSEAAATEEARHYGMHPESATLVEVEGASSRIMDLTHPDVIRQVFIEHVENHELVSGSYYTMLQELIEQGAGGNVVTDYLGYRAKRLGYDGILFFSARALKEIAQYQAFNRNLEGLTYRSRFHELRRDPSLLNVVLFSGAGLVDGIRSIRIGEDEPIANPYHGRGADTVALMFGEHGADYQLERDRFILHKPRYQSTEGSQASA